VTVALAAIETYGRLPDGFDRWDLKDEDGWTLAHYAAEYGGLPDDFSRWDLTNNDGVTVAQWAVEKNRALKGFNPSGA
jgi:ankyrin repeat protein